MNKQFDLLIDTKRTSFNTVRGLKEGDNNSVLNITLVQNSIPFDLTDLTVRINYKRPDNKIFLQMADITNAMEGEININILTKVLSLAGEVRADLSIFDKDNRKITSVTFSMFIDSSIYKNDYIEPEDMDLIQSVYTKEKERQANEIDRVQEESRRIRYEISRQESEKRREDEEEQRQKNEKIRIENENKRIKDEENRKEFEGVRRLNEELRMKQESERNKEDSQRTYREQDRIRDENIRIKNEESRQHGYVNMQNAIDSFSICEEYNPKKEYKKLNRVTYNGSSYECLKDVPTNISPTDTEYWICIAKRGKDGDGAGDMVKEVYDKNNNGVVDMAEEALSVKWDNIENAPNLEEIGKVKSVNGKIGDVVLSGKDIKLSDGTTIEKFKTETETHLAYMTSFERKIYAELQTLKKNKQLKEGKKYLLTDYKTKYVQPSTNVIKEMDIEPLLLTAISNEAFAPIVYSHKHPKDVIYYDIDNNVCEDNKTPRNGFITYRELGDTQNKAPNDCRYMTWIRYRPHEYQYYLYDTLVPYEEWTSGEAELNVLYKVGNTLYMAKKEAIPSSETDPSVFSPIYDDINIPLLITEKTEILHGVVALKASDIKTEVLTFGDGCVNNTIHYSNSTLHNNVFIRGNVSNTIGKNSVNNTFGINNSYNEVKCNNSYNTFDKMNRNNVVEDDCILNYFGIQNKRNISGAFSHNITYVYGNDDNVIGSNSDKTFFGFQNQKNNLGTRSRYNIFISENSNNKLGINTDGNVFNVLCKYNSFGNDCVNNKLGEKCGYNSFEAACHDNTLGDKCQRISFGIDSNENVIGTNCTAISTEGRFVRNKFGDGCTKIKALSFCTDNTFDDGNSSIFIKSMLGKSTVGISELKYNTITTTIEKTTDEKFKYWRLNSKGEIIIKELL
ncbi:phage baseplate upper protein [Clostridium tetani]|uniref:phage baseplate upper protein n=1 Tax=Clostridium tetani TaxID=1513 RepID=UPI00102502AA|nr:phage baseplate upper protein [Clostridium tetani]RXI72141.1 hypothetical protein DP127_07720 [Clostridium tetani]BDR75280.1 hypothetical protein K154306013_09400 [Clostridium tetani]